MRTIKSLAFISIFVAGLVSCKKDGTDQLTGDVSELGQGAYIRLDKTTNAVIDFTNIAGSNLAINVSLLGKECDSIVTYVSTDGTQTFANWRRIKATPVTGPTATISVTAIQLAAALGVNPVTLFQAGNTYTMYNEAITKEKQKFSAINTNTEYVTNGNYSQGFFWKATVGCPFNPGPFTGTFTVLQDDWADFYNPETIPVTPGPAANQISIAGFPRAVPLPNPNASGEPAYGVRTANTIVSVDLASGLATVALQTIGNYTGFPAGSARVAGKGFVFACTQTIDLSLDVTYTTGLVFRANRLLLKK